MKVNHSGIFQVTGGKKMEILVYFGYIVATILGVVLGGLLSMLLVLAGIGFIATMVEK